MWMFSRSSDNENIVRSRAGGGGSGTTYSWVKRERRNLLFEEQKALSTVEKHSRFVCNKNWNLAPGHDIKIM